MQTTTPTVDTHVIDLYGNPFYAALAQAVETLRHAPYWHTDEKAPARLDRACELVRNSRVLLQDERLASVYGSTKAYDVTGFHCTCPQSQKGQSAWCVHAVAVKLARTLAEQAPRPVAPVDPGTLRAGTLSLPPAQEDDADMLGHGSPVDDETLRLPLAPVTIDERLAAVPAQEARMPAPESEYIPEPEDAPVAVLDAPAPPPVTRPLPGPVLLPSLDARTLELSMQAWSAQRQVVKRFLQQELVEGTDYYTLRIGGKATKPALSKAGSEKFMALFQLHATFSQDSATWTMLGQPQGTLCYVCTLHTRGGELIGEGRGARKLQQDNGDINKAVKMAQKSAMVDAILRTGALSDVFTQDLDDAPETPVATATKAKPTSQDLRQRIWAMVQAQAPEVKTRDAVEAWVHQETGYALHPDHYLAIVAALEARA